MLSKKLLSILETFSKRDLTRFGKYLRSPFFNEKEDLVRLFDIIDKAMREKKKQRLPQLEKQVVWKQVYGKQSYNDKKLRSLSSELTKHTYRYLSQKVFQSDPVRGEVLLLHWLETHQLDDKHFNGTVRKARQLQKKKSLQDAAYHYQQYLIDEACQKREKKAEKQSAYLEKSDYHLECFYITRKLKHFSDALHYKRSSSAKVDIEMPQAFLGYVKKRYLSEPSVKAYYLVAQMMMNPEAENHYRELKAFLKEHAEKFTRVELRILYSYLKDYCIDTKIDEGRESYFKELFEIFKELMDNDILLDNGVLDQKDYKNIVRAGLKAKAFDWVERFIEQYGEQSLKETKKDKGTYELAKTYFQQGHFEKAIHQFREMDTPPRSQALESKMMMLKAYYELEEQLVMDSLIESIRIYLRRHRKMSKKDRQPYLNMLEYINKLTQVIPGDTKAAQQLRRQIEGTKALTDKPWLLEKVEALKEKTN